MIGAQPRRLDIWRLSHGMNEETKGCGSGFRAALRYCAHSGDDFFRRIPSYLIRTVPGLVLVVPDRTHNRQSDEVRHPLNAHRLQDFQSLFFRRRAEQRGLVTLFLRTHACREVTCTELSYQSAPCNDLPDIGRACL